jgi:hypothetical protein
MWTVLAVSRRESGKVSGTSKPAASITSGEPSATGALASRAFKLFGNGTAEDPNGGILIGNGFS